MSNSTLAENDYNEFLAVKNGEIINEEILGAIESKIKDFENGRLE